MRALLVLLLLGFAANVSAEIYKWVDEDGTVQYSNRPPPEAPAEKVEITYSQPDPAARQRLDALREADAERRKERAEREAEAELEARQAARLEDNCKRARENLLRLQQSVRIFHTSKEGGRVRVGEEQRQADMKRMQEVIDRDCK